MHNHHAIELPSGRFSLLIAPDRALEHLLDPVASLAWLVPPAATGVLGKFQKSDGLLRRLK